MCKNFSNACKTGAATDMRREISAGLEFVFQAAVTCAGLCLFLFSAGGAVFGIETEERMAKSYEGP
jgi:hypothetical protein